MTVGSKSDPAVQAAPPPFAGVVTPDSAPAGPSALQVTAAAGTELVISSRDAGAIDSRRKKGFWSDVGLAAALTAVLSLAGVGVTKVMDQNQAQIAREAQLVIAREQNAFNLRKLEIEQRAHACDMAQAYLQDEQTNPAISPDQTRQIIQAQLRILEGCRLGAESPSAPSVTGGLR